MSNFYLDVLKDRLYVEAAGSVSRRAAQSTIYKILRGLTLLIAPIIPFTCEEIWSYLPKLDGDSTESVMLHDCLLYTSRPCLESAAGAKRFP